MWRDANTRVIVLFTQYCEGARDSFGGIYICHDEEQKRKTYIWLDNTLSAWKIKTRAR